MLVLLIYCRVAPFFCLYDVSLNVTFAWMTFYCSSKIIRFMKKSATSIANFLLMLTNTASHKQHSRISLGSPEETVPKPIWMFSVSQAVRRFQGLHLGWASIAQLCRLLNCNVQRQSAQWKAHRISELTMNRPDLNRNNSNMYRIFQSAHDAVWMNQRGRFLFLSQRNGTDSLPPPAALLCTLAPLVEGSSSRSFLFKVLSFAVMVCEMLPVIMHHFPPHLPLCPCFMNHKPLYIFTPMFLKR